MTPEFLYGVAVGIAIALMLFIVLVVATRGLHERTVVQSAYDDGFRDGKAAVLQAFLRRPRRKRRMRESERTDAEGAAPGD